MNLEDGRTFLSGQWKSWLSRWFYILFLAGVLVNASGLLLPVMEPDGCLYARISKTMVLSKDYVNLIVDGKDWLDKPHFPFWVAALSFKIFGINGFAYKLPGFLFWLIGAWFVYKWATKLYDSYTGQLATLIYISAEHLIISNNDVRAEPYLTGLIIASVYHYYVVYREKKWINVLYGSIFMAMAVMTKGIFVAAIVGGGFVAEWVIRRNWKEFFNPKWWLAVLLVLIFISPELYCLYHQFDLHPEKIVFGQKQVSGIRFFFWDSQFGRFLNTGPIKGKGDPLFYTHTLLWGFLPWSIFPILLVIFFFRHRSLRSSRLGDAISPAIFITGFLLFSFSKFQLPHYLNILYPFLAIMVAHYLVRMDNPGYLKTIRYTQNFIYVVVFVFCIFICFLSDIKPVLIISFCLIISAVIIYFFFPGALIQNIIGRSFCAILIANIFLNGLFYPELYSYQSGMKAAEYLKRNNVSSPVYTFSIFFPEFALEFYARQPVNQLDRVQLDSLQNQILVFTTKLKVDSLRDEGFNVKELKSFPHFHISQLTGTFLNSRTRYRAIDSSTLVWIIPKTD